tara:strand:+ start:224 stop:421 length:198 start_codon:yes stop_codon:yes gene_type:complete
MDISSQGGRSLRSLSTLGMEGNDARMLASIEAAFTRLPPSLRATSVARAGAALPIAAAAKKKEAI